MMRLNHRSSLLIDKEPVPVTLSTSANRERAHRRSSGTLKAKRIARTVVVTKKGRWW